MEPMRSIFIPKHPLPPTIDFLLRLLILDCRWRKSRKKRGTASRLPANPFAAPWPAANTLGEGAGSPAEPSVMSSELGGAKMREARRGPNREFKTWGKRRFKMTFICKLINVIDHQSQSLSTSLKSMCFLHTNIYALKQKYIFPSWFHILTHPKVFINNDNNNNYKYNISYKVTVVV